MPVNEPTGVQPIFPEFESAVDAFLRAGGHTPLVIRSPLPLLYRYRQAFGAPLPYCGGVRIEEATQEHVSVRGTTISGHDFEWPEP